MSEDRWLRMRFKKNKVWVAVDPLGAPQIEDGRARIRYRPDDDREYRVNPANLRPLEEEAAPTPAVSAQETTPVPEAAPAGPSRQEYKDALVIYTDGASSGNPGPSGIGVVLCWGEHSREISKFIGQATNNIAELEAIRTALEAVRNRRLPVRIHTDSQYAYGLLVLGWKARKNSALVSQLRDLMRKFQDVKIIKVPGHAGEVLNERADFLATEAIRKGEKS
jgi:ribonuclease HI